MTGRIFDIKRFALHDGTGIRTTAFLKGCPLRCPWCQNPEGIDPAPGVWYEAQRCIRCGHCAELCPEGAISFDPERDPAVQVDPELCTACGACIDGCPTGALRWDSRELDSDELVRELARDRVFFESSGGGVTLSGGEPLFQAGYALAVLRQAHEDGLHTAVETTLFVARRVLQDVLPHVDLFLTDLKMWDPEMHREIVGVENTLIVDNIRFLAEQRAAHGRPDLVVRLPLIPELTATTANIRAVARFVSQLPGDIPLELLNFNPLAAGKYRTLGRSYAFSGYTAPYTREEFDEFVDIARAGGARIIP